MNKAQEAIARINKEQRCPYPGCGEKPEAKWKQLGDSTFSELRLVCPSADQHKEPNHE